MLIISNKGFKVCHPSSHTVKASLCFIELICCLDVFSWCVFYSLNPCTLSCNTAASNTFGSKKKSINENVNQSGAFTSYKSKKREASVLWWDDIGMRKHNEICCLLTLLYTCHNPAPQNLSGSRWSFLHACVYRDRCAAQLWLAVSPCEWVNRAQASDVVFQGVCTALEYTSIQKMKPKKPCLTPQKI